MKSGWQKPAILAKLGQRSREEKPISTSEDQAQPSEATLMATLQRVLDADEAPAAGPPVQPAKPYLTEWLVAGGLMTLLILAVAFGLPWVQGEPKIQADARAAPAALPETESLRAQLDERGREITRLEAANAELKGSVAALSGLNAQLKRDNQALNDTLASLQRRVDELTAEQKRTREAAAVEPPSTLRLMGVDTAILQ